MQEKNRSRQQEARSMQGKNRSAGQRQRLQRLKQPWIKKSSQLKESKANDQNK